MAFRLPEKDVPRGERRRRNTGHNRFGDESGERWSTEEYRGGGSQRLAAAPGAIPAIECRSRGSARGFNGSLGGRRVRHAS